MGAKETVSAKTRKRRETQRKLTEIRFRASTSRRDDLAPSLPHEMAPTESLKPATRQVRRRDAKQSAWLQSSIDRFGICRPILIAADRTIIALALRIMISPDFPTLNKAYRFAEMQRQ